MIQYSSEETLCTHAPTIQKRNKGARIKRCMKLRIATAYYNVNWRYVQVSRAAQTTVALYEDGTKMHVNKLEQKKKTPNKTPLYFWC